MIVGVAWKPNKYSPIWSHRDTRRAGSVEARHYFQGSGWEDTKVKRIGSRQPSRGEQSDEKDCQTHLLISTPQARGSTLAAKDLPIRRPAGMRAYSWSDLPG